MSDIQRIRNLTDDSSLGSFKNEVIVLSLQLNQTKFYVINLNLNLGTRSRWRYRF